jgi:putative transposase
VTINGQLYYLWRAVDSEGMVLDILMQTRLNAQAAKRFFEGVLGKTGTRPRVLVTDSLQSYNVIARDILPNVEHRRSKYLNNRAENSHQPTRRRERRMQRFKSTQQAQLFLSIFDIVWPFFHPKKHQLTAVNYRWTLDQHCHVWATFVG